MARDPAAAAGPADADDALSDPQLDIPAWTFLTNHAHVLLSIARDPELRQRDIAHVVGITPGAVVRILHELEDNGYVSVERVGRRNRYQLDLDATLRHPLDAHHTVGDLIAALAD
ncbi:helix-turn-helix transcriptional regulator [Ilumatobacter nonamiensis]|uniref:helix-turn-helix transcriptional regulator n=1 Tax=Ilumatobacter nonamiensis TaxID=467093 RepID=UPI001F4C8E93|nr:winged helix-turn-helix domain-containing protein [Ilumatobacter nonamiensis]